MSWAGGRMLNNEAVLTTISSYTTQVEATADADTARAAVTSTEGSGRLDPTPSTDPELWAAIYSSLEEQSKQRRRQLSRHLSEASPELAARLRQHRMEQTRCSPEGVTYFEEAEAASSPCTGDGSGKAVASGLVLPSFSGYHPAVREVVLGQLCNEALQQEAEQAGIINWLPSCTQQLVLATLGDGNCLSHACSLGMWGVHDRDGRLRGAIRDTMAHPVAGQHIRQRFERQLDLSGIPQEGWEAEWDREMWSLADSSTYLSDVHCFILANVLRRPLIIYGDAEAAAAALAGIYLPLLWPNPQAQCFRQPLAILYSWSHFSLLATVQGEGSASPPLLPLSTRDGPLQLRFLSAADEGEQQQVQQQQQQQARQHTQRQQLDSQLRLLRRYMDAELIYNDCLGVRLSEVPRPHVMVELLGSMYLRQAADQQEQEEHQARQYEERQRCHPYSSRAQA